MSLLRGPAAPGAPSDKKPNRLPGECDPSFSVDPGRPAGIKFYPLRGAFFLPYGNLQSVTWTQDTLVLSFATDTVTVMGSGLHDLFVAISEYRVSRIHVGAATPSEGAATEVADIVRLPRG